MVQFKIGPFIWFVLFSLPVFGQGQGAIIGEVSDENGDPVPYASIMVKGTEKGASADESGKFSIEELKAGEVRLRVTSVGYRSREKTVLLKEGERKKVGLQMKQMLQEMDEVIVTGTRKEEFLRESPVKVEVISPRKLEANPSNNLVSSLGQVNGVREQVNCGVCGTNNIRINGMAGPYTLVMIDGMPIMSSLASVYGFNGIPNSLVERVEVIKGPSSTLYGTRAVGGVINILTRKPHHNSMIGGGASYTSHGEFNADFMASQKIGDNVQTLVSVNYFNSHKRFDENGDDFTDLPLAERFSLFNKWKFTLDQGKEAGVAMRYYNEDRFGGLMDWQEEDRGSSSVYGESVETRRWELFGNYDLPFDEDLTLNFSFSDHFQDSYYGDEHFLGEQTVVYADLVWDRRFGRHDILAGVTGRYRDYSDQTKAQSDQEKIVPGFFLQDEWSLTEKSTVLGGGRLDYHKTHGLIFSPRLNVKQSFSRYTTARLNFGTGFREVDLFTEDHAAISGTREVLIQEELAPERSYNLSLNLHHIYTLGESTGTLDLDGFYTYFSNKIIPDYNSDPNKIIYANLDGYGISRGMSFSVDQQFRFPLEFGLGATYQNVYQVDELESGETKKQPELLSPVFTGVFNAGYTIKPWKLSLQYTGNLQGPQPLPQYPEPFSRPERSPWYSIHNFKISKQFRHHFHFYVAAKNIFDYIQPSPLIDAENPYSEHFDTEYIYGPLRGRRFMVGLKWMIHSGEH